MAFNPFSELTSKIYGIVAIAAIAAAGVQTVRVAERDATIATRDATITNLNATIDAIAAAQEHARERAKAARLEREKIYSDLAERIDENADAKLDGALDAAERFIAAGGVRREADRGESGRTGAGTEDRSSGSADGAGRAAELDDSGGAGPDRTGSGLVLVTAEDVRICTRNTIKAEAGYELAVGLEAASAR